MKNLLRENRVLFVLLTGFYVLFVSLIWLQFKRQTATDRDETIRAAIQHNDNLAITLEQHTLRTLRDADATLQMVKQEYLQSGYGINLKTFLTSGLFHAPHFDGLVITDSIGKVILIYPGEIGSKEMHIGDRAFFPSLKTNKDKLIISEPLESRSIQQQVIVLSRSIHGADGRFLGAIAMQLLPSTFMSFYSEASLKKYDILSLISPDGITYSRRTGSVESSGENIRKSPLFEQVKKSPVGSYFARDAIRNIPTYFSYRKLADYPIIATVGSTEADILARFNERQKRESFFGFISSFLLLIFLLVIFVALSHRRHIMQVLRQSEARYRLIFESSRDGILLVQHNGKVEALNRAATAMFEHITSPDQVFSFQDLYEKTEPAISCITDENNCFCIEEKETVFHTRNGRKFIGEIASSSFKDGGGHWYTLVLVRDVTQRKRIEQKLQNEQKRYQRIMTRQMIIAQEQEREHIGHELHDNVNQILTTVKLYLETAQEKQILQKEMISRSIGYLQQCIHEIRHLSHRLSAPTLGTQSLVDSLQALIESVSTLTDFDIHLCLEKYREPIGKERSLAIYRIVQEQLNNIIKHAGATRVTIQLLQTEEETILQIEDNGQGFDPLARSKGIGLNNITSRVKAFNGRLSVDSGVGQGCRLKVSFSHKEEVEMTTA